MNPDPFFPAVYEDLKVNMLDTKFIPFPKLPFSSLSIETHNFQDRSSMLTLHCSPPRSSHAKLIALFFILAHVCTLTIGQLSITKILVIIMAATID